MGALFKLNVICVGEREWRKRECDGFYLITVESTSSSFSLFPCRDVQVTKGRRKSRDCGNERKKKKRRRSKKGIEKQGI